MIPIDQLKQKLSEMDLPENFQLNEHTFIKYPKKFIETSFAQLERNKNNRTFLPTYERLCEFYQKIKT